jgi:sec-independent protein translocase protein TatA
MFGLGPSEVIILGILGVLLFGKRLPEVGRQLGQGIIEFKKGLNGLKADLHNPDAVPNRATAYRSPDDYQEPTAPRFEPPTSEPQPVSADTQ